MTIETLQLQDRLTRLTLAPAIGGSISNWIIKQNGNPLLRHSDLQALNSASPRRLSCYPLAPWSNRIGGGGFANPQGWLALCANADNSPLPIHGSAWQQPWDVVEHSEGSALLRLDSQIPFAYRAEQLISLHEGRLDIRLQVTHLADASAWHGLGLHPYFPRTAETRLQAHAEQVWHCNAEGLSTELSARPEAWNFSTERSLPADIVDNAFTGWDGRARITQRDAGYCLDMEAKGSELFLLFCPEELPFFCVEPVSHPVNAHHMHGRPGLRLLEKQQSMWLSLTLQYRTLD